MARFTILIVLSLLLSVPVAAQECNTSTVMLPSGETSVCHLDCSGAIITCDFAGWSWDWASEWTAEGYPDSASVQNTEVGNVSSEQSAAPEFTPSSIMRALIGALIAYFR